MSVTVTSALFNPDAWYRAGSPEMAGIAATATLAKWRCDGRGPRYSKTGTGQNCRILYSGADLIRWLEGQRVKA